MEVDEGYSRLEAEINAEIDLRVLELEDERRKRLEALKLLWPSIIATFGSQASATVLNQDMSASNNGVLSGKRRAFPMRQAIRDIINGLEENAKFDQPHIYNELVNSHPELRESPPPNIRAQIASVLNWLTHKEKVLAIAKEGRGSVPNIYRKKTYEELAMEDESIDQAEAEYRAARQRFLVENAEGVNK